MQENRILGVTQTASAVTLAGQERPDEDKRDPDVDQELDGSNDRQPSDLKDVIADLGDEDMIRLEDDLDQVLGNKPKGTR